MDKLQWESLTNLSAGIQESLKLFPDNMYL